MGYVGSKKEVLVIFASKVADLCCRLPFHLWNRGRTGGKLKSNCWCEGLLRLRISLSVEEKICLRRKKSPANLKDGVKAFLIW